MAFNETNGEVSKTPESNKLDFDADKLIGSENKESRTEVGDNKNAEPVDADKLIEPARSEHRDDNGELYRIGDNFLPNKTYESCGYSYKTDSHGRIASAEGQLRLDDSPRKSINTTIEKIGKGDQCEGDERGHLMGDRFGGSNSIENMALMGRKVNRTDFLKIENDCAKALENGGEAYMKITPKYEGDSNRAASFRVVCTINGERNINTLRNEGGPE